MSKYLDDNNHVVTIFSRKKLRPAIEDTSRPTEGAIPRNIYFVLPDGSAAEVDTRHEIVIGRQARPDDPPVTVDLEPYDGHELGVSRQHCMMKVLNDKLILVDLDRGGEDDVDVRPLLPQLPDDLARLVRRDPPGHAEEDLLAREVGHLLTAPP